MNVNRLQLIRVLQCTNVDYTDIYAMDGVIIMKIGICAAISELSKVQSIGFDYIEWSVADAASMSYEGFAEVHRKVEESSIKVEACNCFFPWGMKIVGPEADFASITEYIKMALHRVAALGAKTVVVGSGGAREVPNGWDMEEGIKQFGEVLRKIGEIGAQYGIIAVVEPLNKGETNIINSVADGLAFVKKVNHPNVKLLADFYHMRLENESMDVLIATGDELKHMHIANSNERTFPKKAGEDDYAGFFNAIKSIAYNGRLSIEAYSKDFDFDAPESMRFLNSMI